MVKAPNMPKPGAKVVVAMSGGVDSSVSAGWLKQLGYEVVGISLQLHDMAQKVSNEFGTCCSLSDISDARRVAEKMEIPFYVADMESEFEASVIDDFVHEYLNGRTPNPCVRCNEKVKFNRLMDWAMDLGADYLATGHYANVRFNPETEEHELVKGADLDKDQSYFLFTMRQQDLKRIMFPVGGLQKKQVRELASELGLVKMAQKPDSQEICFVQGKSYREFIESRVPAELLQKGRLLDTAGNVIGEHEGLHHYTVGQRKGLGVSSPLPMYVIAMDADRNEVVIGPEESLLKKKCVVSNVNWINRLDFTQSQNLKAKIRYRAKEAAVQLFPLLDNRVEVQFAEGQRAITPGQALVLYDDDRVVGGGWIEEVS